MTNGFIISDIDGENIKEIATSDNAIAEAFIAIRDLTKDMEKDDRLSLLLSLLAEQVLLLSSAVHKEHPEENFGKIMAVTTNTINEALVASVRAGLKIAFDQKKKRKEKAR